jgi:hypothetical protein
MSTEETPTKKSALFRVALCIPTRGEHRTEFTQSLVRMVAYTTATMVADRTLDLGFIFHGGTYVDKNRQDIALKALTDGATHLLWLDDDMVFPPDTLLRLLVRNQPIVGCNYPQRKMPAFPTAIKYDGYGEHPRAQHYPTHDPENPLSEVDAIGFGCLLIQAPVFDALADKVWFRQYYADKNERWVGEDVYFSRLARQAGYKVLVDEELSNELRHIGTFEFHLGHSETLKDEHMKVLEETYAKTGG